MKYAYLWGIVALSVVVFLFLIVRVISLGNEIQALDARNGHELAALQDSLKRAQADLASAKEAVPGLGEYMTTIQLHVGKLWFAAKASNWELANYELDELKETMEAAPSTPRKMESKSRVFSIRSSRLRLPSWPNLQSARVRRNFRSCTTKL